MIFPRWDATGFDCLLPQSRCPEASASEEHSHYIYSPEEAGYFHEKKIFSKCSGGGKKVKKNLWKYLFLVSYCLPAGCQESSFQGFGQYFILSLKERILLLAM